MNTDGEVMEAHAELFDIELTSYTKTIACCYLVIVGQMLIDLADIVFLREGIDNTFL